MNDQYIHYQKSAYYAHAAPVCPTAAGYTQPSRPKQAATLTEIDTGASLGSLVDDFSRPPFEVKLWGENGQTDCSGRRRESSSVSLW